jgi:3-hydroxybutyryl-CoA dehydrogenase
MQKITVIGSGVMGSGIAQVIACSGFNCRMVDLTKELVEKGFSSIKRRLKKEVEKGKIKDEEEILGRIQLSTELEDAKDSGLIIEAVVESMDVKKEVFSQLDRVCGKETILASNTSSLSITELASATSRPDRVVGLHFFNPAYRMELVEIVRGLHTSEETIEKMKDFSEKIGKKAIVVKDSCGFVVNRLLLPFLNEAIYLLQEGIASKEEIDKGVKLGLNHPMGPFELADLIGLDVLHSILEVMHKEFGERFRPSPLLRSMVRAGNLGRKSGRGFYAYEYNP